MTIIVSLVLSLQTYKLVLKGSTALYFMFGDKEKNLRENGAIYSFCRKIPFGIPLSTKIRPPLSSIK